MSLRMNLANWISGGEVEACSRWRSAYRHAETRARFSLNEAYRYKIALVDISSMETPGANATVRRMANTARKALGE